MSRNLVILIGNVGFSPEIRTFENGNKVANFSIATSEGWKDKESGEKKEVVDWHNIAVFGKLVEIVEKYIKKGQQLYIEGMIKTRSWEDKDGNKKYMTEVVLKDWGHKLEIMGSKSENTNQQPSNETPPPQGEDDLPF